MEKWTVAFHPEFEPEFEKLAPAVQDELYAEAIFVERFGPETGRPHVDKLKGSRYPNMKELRFEAANGALRSRLIRDAGLCFWLLAIRQEPARRSLTSGSSPEPMLDTNGIFSGSKKDDKAERCGFMKTLRQKLSKLPAGRRKKIATRAASLIAEEMTMRELRKARTITQSELAKTLGVRQEQISRIEKRTDMHISTLRRAVEGMGGELTLTARFSDRPPVKLSGLSDPKS